MSDEFGSQMQIIERESTYFNAHRDELRRLYPDRYVAILHGRVIDSDPSLAQLAERVYREIGNQTVLMRHTKLGQPTFRIGAARNL